MTTTNIIKAKKLNVQKLQTTGIIRRGVLIHLCRKWINITSVCIKNYHKIWNVNEHKLNSFPLFYSHNIQITKSLKHINICYTESVIPYTELFYKCMHCTPTDKKFKFSERNIPDLLINTTINITCCFDVQTGICAYKNNCFYIQSLIQLRF